MEETTVVEDLTEEQQVSVASSPDLTRAQAEEILERDDTLPVLKALLLNPVLDSDISERLVMGSQHYLVLQKWALEKTAHTESLQVRIARDGANNSRWILARTRQPMCLEAQRILADTARKGPGWTDAVTGLAQRPDLHPEVILALSHAGSEPVSEALFRNANLIDSHSLSYSHYQAKDQAGLERIRVELGVDAETWHSVGPAWEGDLDTLAEACKMTSR